MNLALSLLAAAERNPRREALPGITYAELRERAARIAGGLGLERGERLATVLDNRVETALLYWAAQWGGRGVRPALVAGVAGRSRLLHRRLRRQGRDPARTRRFRTGPSIPARSTWTSASRA